MRVEITDTALTKKILIPLCVYWKKKKKKKKMKIVNHWHPITVVLVEAINELWHKKEKKKKNTRFWIQSSNEGPSIIDGHEATSNFITKFVFFFFWIKDSRMSISFGSIMQGGYIYRHACGMDILYRCGMLPLFMNIQAKIVKV